MDTKDYGPQLRELGYALKRATAVVVGAGAGMSTAAGFQYSGERFQRLFPDFIAKYGFTDMYSAGFHDFASPKEFWAYWSRYIWHNRFEPAPKDTYSKLLKLLEGTDYFIITTNVDHQFQLAGASKDLLFYTQGDYGLFQCSTPCHQDTYDNYLTVKAMVARQRDMKVPADLILYCPRCNEPMTMNLRADSTFVEDEGWHQAAARYRDFLAAHETGQVLYLELGVGANTPVIIKYPFWRRVYGNPDATYACVNAGQAFTAREIADRSILIDADIDQVLGDLLAVAPPDHAVSPNGVPTEGPAS